MAAVKALQKELEDALRATEDAQREAEQERLVVAMVENIHDGAQVEAAHLRAELEGLGHSLPISLPTSTALWAVFLVFSFDTLVLVGLESREEVHHLSDQLHGTQEEVGRL